MEKVRIINTSCLASKTTQDVKDYIKELIEKKIGGYSVAINAEKVIMYNRFESVKETIEKCVLPTIDGEGVPWALRLIYGIQTNKVDLPVTTFELANDLGLKVFLLGSKEEYNKLAFDNIKIKYPNIKLVGRLNGYFGENENAKKALREANPDIVILALGSPKQELLATELQEDLSHTIFICAGGAINVQAGIRKRPPKKILQNKIFPLEWLYVLITDPNKSRLKRQYALPIFFLYSLRDFMLIRVLKLKK